MRYLPLFADIAGRACVVIGAGPVAAQKLRLLLEAQARVTVIAPKAIAGIEEAASAGQIDWLAREYRDGDLQGKTLAFAATGDPTVQMRIAAEAARAGVWLNCVDEPDRSGFVMPAILERGPITVAVGTSGASPALAAHLRDRIGATLGTAAAACAKHLASLRDRLPPGSVRQAALRRLVEAGILEAFQAGDRAEIDRLTAAAVTEAEDTIRSGSGIPT